MKKIPYILLLLASKIAIGQDPAPSNVVQLTTNTPYYQTTTGLHWYYNGTTYLWYKGLGVKDSTYYVTPSYLRLNYYNKTQSDARYAPISGGGGYVPYTGATTELNLNQQRLTGNFTGAGLNYSHLLNSGVLTTNVNDVAGTYSISGTLQSQNILFSNVPNGVIGNTVFTRFGLDNTRTYGLIDGNVDFKFTTTSVQVSSSPVNANDVLRKTDFNTLGDARYPLLSGSYANPSWITSLPWSKITGTPDIVNSFNTRTGIVTLTSGDVTAALGFTPENVANKTATQSSSTTTYPNWLGVTNYVGGLSSVYQPLNAKLTSISALANASGGLTNDGSGNFSYVAYAPSVTYAANTIYKGDGSTIPVASGLKDYGVHIASSKIFGVYNGFNPNPQFGLLNVKNKILEVDTSTNYRGIDVLMQGKSVVTNTTKVFQGGHMYADLDATSTANWTNTNYSFAGLAVGARVNTGATGNIGTMVGIFQSNTMGNNPSQTISNMYGTLYLINSGTTALTNQARIAIPANNYATNNTYLLAGSRIIRTGNWFIDADSVTYASRLGGTITTTGALLKTAKGTYNSLEYLPGQRTDSLYAPISGSANYEVPLTFSTGLNRTSNTIKADTSVLQTVGNFFTKGNTKYGQLGATNAWTALQTFNNQTVFNNQSFYNSGFGIQLYNSANTFYTSISNPTLTANRQLTPPDASGTLALVSGNLGTPSTLVGTNITGTASGLTAGTVTTNANLTGYVTSVGNATSLAKNIALNGVSINAWNAANNTIDLLNGTGGSVFSNTNTAVGTGLAQNAYLAGTGGIISRLGLGNAGTFRVASGGGIIYNFRGYGAAGTSTGTQTTPFQVDTLGNETLVGNIKYIVGSDATNDMYYRLSTGFLARIAAGTTGQILSNTSGVPGFTSTLASTITATTQSANDNSTKVATTAYVDRLTGVPTGSDGQIAGYHDGGVPIAIGRLSLQNAYSYSTPTTGGTVTLTNNQRNIINPSGALLALTIAMPSSPSDGDVVEIKFTQNVTTVTYTGGTVVDGITSPTAGGLTTFLYRSATSSWY